MLVNHQLGRMVAIAGAVASLAFGSDSASAVVESPLEAQLRAFLAENTAAAIGRVEIEVGQIDPRQNLQPCRRIEPFIPQGRQLWGRTSIGLRCADGPNWTILIPVNVRVFGRGLVATRAIQANQPLGPDDTSEIETELSRDPGLPVQDPNSLVERTLSRSIAAGTLLRQDWLKQMPVIIAGDAIRLVVNGRGFQLATEGTAVNSASEGQAVRVRVDSGRLVQARARTGKTAEVMP
jgi:flagellar basal body P-ring formation protein FlgA